ncbi:MAG TPA: hypothetical protein VK681_39340 [Reyranella sp.]|nr:hypothetical protein [Reyranella sp.]
MGFGDDLARFQAKVEHRALDVHNRVCELAFQSIVNGSAITGAPGQPVDTGFLKGSWHNLILGPLARQIVTNAIYAPDIEDGARKGRAARGIGEGDSQDLVGEPDIELHLRSQVGGFHSVKLTRLGWEKLVAQAVREVDTAIGIALSSSIAGAPA